MRFWNWEGWPWNWREVRRAEKISKEDRDIFERYTEAVVATILASNPSTTEIHAYIAGQDYEASSQGRRPAARDWLTERADAHERREQRLEFVEIGIVALITLEILLSLYFGLRAISEGRQQAEILKQMNKNTQDTAAQIQKAVGTGSALLEVQRVCADQARKFFTDPGFERKDWTEYVSHYDPKAESCYVLIRNDLHLLKTQWSVAFLVFDAFEGNLRAHLQKDVSGPGKVPYACSVKLKGQKEIFCKTEEEFDTLIEKYLGMERP